MKNYKIEYDIDYSDFADFIRVVEERLQRPSRLAEAIETAGNYAVNEWIRTASSKFRHSQGGYAQGIVQGTTYPFNEDPLHFRIQHTKPYAYMLEIGYSGFDMKKMLETSQKVRISKAGKRYLIIPFRHGNPNSKGFRPMPQAVYDQAKNMRQSTIAGTYREGSQQPARTFQDAQFLKKNNPNKVRRFKYNWGDKLEDKNSIYHGMVRFQSNPNKVRVDNSKFGVNPTGSDQNYSQYITFRVMSEDSQGWHHSGIKGMSILKDTVSRIRQPILQMMKEALREDLKELGFGD